MGRGGRMGGGQGRCGMWGWGPANGDTQALRDQADQLRQRLAQVERQLATAENPRGPQEP